MLTLKSLTFGGIGRFVEEQTVDFTQLGPLVQVDGQNSNTGGSSGSGKSTIFKALEYLLGINDISNGVLQSRLTKDSMSVTGIFDLDGIPLKIQRNKKFLIDLNGEVTTGSSKVTEERLDQIIGMPRDLFRKIIHKRQGEGGFFLDMGPSDVHKFLTDCLGLQKEQSKVQVLDNRISVLLGTETSLKSAIESSKMGLEATKSAIASLGSAPTLDIDPEAVEELKIKHNEAVESHKLVRNVQKAEMESLEQSRPQVSIPSFDRSRAQSLEKEINDIKIEVYQFEKAEQNRQAEVKAKISELQILASKLSNSELTRQSDVKNQISSVQLEVSKIEKDEQNRQATVRASISSLQMELMKNESVVVAGSKAKQDAISLAKELQKIRSSVCPTCEQGWVKEASKIKEAQILDKLLDYKKLVVAGNEATNKISLINEQLKNLNIDLQPKPTTQADSLREKISQLKLEAQPRVVAEVTEINYKVEHFKLESQPKLVLETVDLNRLKSLKESLLQIEYAEEANYQQKENAKTQAILSEFANRQTMLRKSHDESLKAIQDEESRSLNEYNAAKNKIKSFEDNKKRFEDSHAKLSLQVAKYDLEANAKDLELMLVREEIELATESKKAIKSYLSCSFEDALNSIGDTATKFIRHVPNMQNGTIQFDGLKETKEGKIKEEVTCLISMDGEIGIPVKSLSGGERSSTDLAIDLAVMEFIQEKAGKGTNFLILDEPFSGLDESNISCIVELLRESGINKQILIVDHNPIIKEAFESKITVIRDGLTSKVVQQ